MRKWIVVCGKYEGLKAAAVNLLVSEMSKYVKFVVPVCPADSIDESAFADKNVVILGTLSDNKFIAEKYDKIANGNEEGYAFEVKAKDDKNIITIAANTMQGLYYGVVDFISVYIPTIASTLYPNVNLGDVFNTPFNCLMPEFKLERSPKIKNRAIWTWGHCILDYKKFFENMALLKLNEIVIWNDYIPANAKEVVDYAHSYGIKVIWGFAWGWDVQCGNFNIKDCFDPEKIAAFAAKTLKYYKDNILPTKADGIYFQSFTELTIDNIDGINIAEAVTAWVNGIAKAIYKKYPELEIQFGLHATSVNQHLNVLANVDKRIKIVWEDCGAFPYNYSPALINDYEQTVEFTENTTRLRGEQERFGCVYKGMTTLYWHSIKYDDAGAHWVESFDHIEGPFILGENSEEEINAVYTDRLPSWKYIQAEWIKNANCVRDMTNRIAGFTKGNTDVQLLVEYGAFEKAIMFPVAFAAETLWQPDDTTENILERVLLNPNVKTANV